ncbi:hypothetical protein GCM10023200_24060 [Actinomycetospora chlora]|uniref:J domain-containing protein n=1 Tax=Actinomycetospora chlora TaxID=663608 RepID=A0ABP9B0Q8_9PSEU
MTTSSTHYELLGVPAGCSQSEIRAAYLRMARRVHSDHGGSDALFRLVQEAYEVLHDPARRAAYDRTLRSTGRDTGERREREQQAREQREREDRDRRAREQREREERERQTREQQAWERHVRAERASSQRRAGWWWAAAVAVVVVVTVVFVLSSGSPTGGVSPAASLRRIAVSVDAVAVAPGGRTAYAADTSGNLVVIDVAAGAVLRTEHVQDVAPSAYPTPSLAVAPDGARVYLSYKSNSFLPGSTAITVVDGRTGSRTADLPYPDANAVAVSADGRELYVATDERIAVVDTASGTEARSLPLPATALAPTTGGRAYVVTASRVALVDLARGVVVGRPATVGFSTRDLVAAPDGTRAYLSSNSTADGTAAVSTFRPDTGGVALSYVAPGTPARPAAPEGLAASADGRRLYAVFGYPSSPSPPASTLAALDTSTPQLRPPGEVSVPPARCLVAAPDDGQVYVCSSSSVSTYDVSG